MNKDNRENRVTLKTDDEKELHIDMQFNEVTNKIDWIVSGDKQVLTESALSITDNRK